MSSDRDTKLDKWLWAARLYRTRPLARAAILQGYVLLNESRVSPSQKISIDDCITITQNNKTKKIRICLLSTRRGNVEESCSMFEVLPQQDFYQENPPLSPYGVNSDLKRKSRFLRRNNNKSNNSQPINYDVTYQANGNQKSSYPVQETYDEEDYYNVY